MDNPFIFLSILILAGLVAVIFILLKKKEGGDEKMVPFMERLVTQSEQLNQLNRQNTELRQELDRKLSETHRANQGQFEQTTKIIQNITGQSAKLIADVTEKLTKLDETNKQVVNFSAQLQSLQDILKNPKQRGILGEYYLEVLLKNIFAPDQYQMQYKFSDGEIVDSVVFIRDKIVPIDSKFSLENYNRLVEEQDPVEHDRLEKAFVNDLKQRIVETSKYIRPQEGTMDFAFMFIPHEAIYYDLLINRIGAVTEDTESLLQRAATKYHVIIVSPTSFSAYLQTVLQGLNALKIEEQAKEIQIRVADLGRHLSAYEQHFSSVGKHLGTVVNQYNLATKDFSQIDKDVLRMTGQSGGYKAELVDGVRADEG